MNPTYLEYAANGFYLLAVFLAARNSIHTWWLGIIGCALFAVLFYQVKLYAEVLLMLFFVATNLIGWYQWGRASGIKQVSSTPLLRLAGYGALALLVTALYGYMLHSLTDAYAPFVDSAILMFSVIAQFLLMNRRPGNLVVLAYRKYAGGAAVFLARVTAYRHGVYRLLV